MVSSDVEITIGIGSIFYAIDRVSSIVYVDAFQSTKLENITIDCIAHITHS